MSVYLTAASITSQAAYPEVQVMASGRPLLLPTAGLQVETSCWDRPISLTRPRVPLDPGMVLRDDMDCGVLLAC